MKYWKTLYFLLTITNTWEVYTIMTGTKNIIPSPSIKNFRPHINSIPQQQQQQQQIDWELGLREATYQALLREQYVDPHLHEHLLEATLLNRQDTAIPFGDIIVLARGQLYVTSNGYQFIQDPYQNDCDDCHNERNRCNRLQCQIIHHKNINERLLALWTVKRIRHRDPNFGYIFELEYTISPIGTVISEGFVTRNGRFDYSVPGHIFVIKSNPRLNQAYHLNSNNNNNNKNRNNNNQEEENLWYRNQEQNPINYKLPHNNQDIKTNFKPGIIIGIDSNGNQQILHSYPAFFTAYHPHEIQQEKLTEQQSTTNDPKEFELYKKLIDSLASKTVPPNKHRFSVKANKDKLTSTTTKTTYHIKPTQETTNFLQFTTENHLIPTTGNILIPTTTTTENNEPLHIITPIYIPTTISKNPDTTKLLIQTTPITTQSNAYYPQIPQTTPTSPQITLHYFTPTEEKIEENHLPITTTTQTKQIINTTPLTKTTKSQQQSNKKLVNNFNSNLVRPIKITTIASKEEDEDFDLFFDKTPTQPMKSSTPILSIQQTTTTTPTITKQISRTTTMKYNKKPTTLEDIEENEDEDASEDNNEDLNLFSTHHQTTQSFKPSENIKPTATTQQQDLHKYLITDNPPATEPIIEDSTINKSYLNPVNEQIQPPDSETDTTIPYAFSTVTEKSFTIPNDSMTITINEFTTVPLIESTIATTKKIEMNTINNRKDFNFMQSSLNIPQTTDSITKEQITVPITSIKTTHMSYPNTEIPSTTTQHNIKDVTLPKEIIQITNKDETTTTESVLKTTTLNDIIVDDIEEESEIPSTLDTTLGELEEIKDTTIDHVNQDMTTNYDRITEPIQTTQETTIKYKNTISPLLEHISTTTTSTTKLKPSTTKIVTLNEFLVDSLIENTTEDKFKNKININEDDIFGNEKKEISTIKQSPKVSAVKESEFADELFGNNNNDKRKSKILINPPLTATTTTNEPIKIIFSNFYAASTELPPTTFDNENLTLNDMVMEKAAVYEVTTNNLPFTDQSYSTSISFEVNKRNNNTNITNNDSTIVLEPTTIKAKLSEIVMNKNNTNFKIYQAELPPLPMLMNNERNETISKEESKKVFDNLALQLVNHARSIDYLNKKPKTKYKRRGYKPKNKRGQQRV